MWAIQYAAVSRFHHLRSGILDHPLSRMMTVGVSDRIQISNSSISCRHSFAISPRISREFCSKFPPSSIKGAGNAGRSTRPQPRV